VLAAREIYDRCLGKPKQTLDVDMDVEQTMNLTLDELINKKFEQMSEDELLATVIRGDAYRNLPLNCTLRRQIEGYISGYPDMSPDTHMRQTAERVMALANQQDSQDQGLSSPRLSPKEPEPAKPKAKKRATKKRVKKRAKRSNSKPWPSSDLPPVVAPLG
jgi:hypothetical protein